MENLIILGAGGHGRVVADIARLMSCYREIVFLDDKPPADGFPYRYGGTCDAFRLYLENNDFVIGIGNAVIRHRFQNDIEEAGGHIATLIHPSAVISPDVEIGRGTVVMAGAIVNTGTRIGKGKPYGPKYCSHRNEGYCQEVR